jgi:hypothetical protein
MTSRARRPWFTGITRGARADAAKGSAPIPDAKGRYQVRSLEDVAALRRHRPETPADLNPADSALWDRYLRYWDKRLNVLQRQFRKHGAASANPPCTFEKYRQARGKYDDLGKSKQ